MQDRFRQIDELQFLQRYIRNKKIIQAFVMIPQKVVLFHGPASRTVFKKIKELFFYPIEISF